VVGVDAVEHGGARCFDLLPAQDAVVIGVEPVEDRVGERPEDLRIGDDDAEKQKSQDDGDGHKGVRRMSAGKHGFIPSTDERVRRVPLATELNEPERRCLRWG
jgi:hypothetical protein